MIVPLGKQTREEMGEIDRKKGFRDSPASLGRALSAELMEFRQKYPQSTLLQCTAGLLRDPTTEEEDGQLTEGLLEPLQALRHQISVKNSQLCVPLATRLGYSLEERRWMVSHNCVSAILQSAPTLPPPKKKKTKTSIGIPGGSWMLPAMDGGIC